MTSTQRSRLFRKRHPGYYQRLHARKTAEIKARAALLVQSAAPVKVPLALPAPVVQLPTLFDYIREQQKREEKLELVEGEMLETHRAS